MELHKKQLDSSYLDCTMDYFIWKPRKLDKDHYILYVQDGIDYMELGELFEAHERIMKQLPSFANKLVFILIPPSDSNRRWHSYHRKGKYFSNYIHFVNRELCSELETELLKADSKAIKRGLLGDSLGGNICLNIAMQCPQQWTHLLLQSAAMTEDEIEDVKNVDERVQWKVYQSVGIYEDDYISQITNEKLYILSRNRMLYSALNQKNEVETRYSEQETHHLWEVWRRDLVNALLFFLQN